MKLVERFRGHVLEETLALGSFGPDWPDRRAFLASKLSAGPGRRDVVDLGMHLSAAHRLAGGRGRAQAAVTQSGAAWQALVVYYLNMIYAGTPVVAVSPRHAPRSVKAAMKVSYQGTAVLGDLDVALLVLPAGAAEEEPGGDSPRRRHLAAMRRYHALFDQQFQTAYVSLVACKTNWNDSVQTPMLWNLLYSLRRDQLPLPSGIAIGDSGYSLDMLAGFTFSFVTVPTNKLENFKTDSMPVQRSRAFTGGYYWGYPSRTGVVDNISALPDRHASKAPSIMPSVSSCGAAFAAAVAGERDRIDYEAFAWTPGDDGSNGGSHARA